MNLTNIDKTGWKKWRFDQIAFSVSERVEPQQTALAVYVGLEHLDSDSLHIKRFGVPTDVSGTKLKVYPGDVIFGKRRAYQRKAAIANFEGICSAHAMVLRANKEVIDPQLFPFFLHSDAFMNLAIDISVGSLSPTINWKTLRIQEFLLPPKEEQAQLAELLWAGDEVVERYGELEKIIEVVRQGFHREVFPIPETLSIGEIATKVGSGKTPRGGDKVYLNEGILFLRSQNILSGTLSLEDCTYIDEETDLSMKSSRVAQGDVLLNITGASIGRSAVFNTPVFDTANVNQHVCIIRSPDYDSMLLCEYLNSEFGQEQVEMLQTNGNRQGLNFQNLRLLSVPDFNPQEQKNISQKIRSIIASKDETALLKKESKLLQRNLINQFFTS